MHMHRAIIGKRVQVRQSGGWRHGYIDAYDQQRECHRIVYDRGMPSSSSSSSSLSSMCGGGRGGGSMSPQQQQQPCSPGLAAVLSTWYKISAIRESPFPDGKPRPMLSAVLKSPRERSGSSTRLSLDALIEC